MDQPPIISLRNVQLRYQTAGRSLFNSASLYSALSDVSLDVYPSETLALIRRNGSGKTSLLKLIAGVLRPDGGQITRSSISISMLSLQVGFLPHLTGKENAILGAILLGKTKAAATAVLPEIEAFAELGSFIDQPLMTYSSGMRARLGFSVAYYAAADVLLIDEVLGVGDQDFRRKSSRAIKDMIASNRTVVLVSHSIPTIRELADRIVWVEDGETKLEGSPDYVLSEYTAQ